MKLNKALIQIAAQHGVSVAEVRRDIQAALDEGWNNPDPKVQEYWRKIPCRGEKPTLEEVITFMAKKTRGERNEISMLHRTPTLHQ